MLRLSAVLAAALLLPPAAPLSVFVAGPLVRVRPKDAPGTAVEATVKAARNEVEAFQVVVHAGEGGLKNVTLEASDLKGDGRAIDKKQIALFREYYVAVKQPSPQSKEGAGIYPDALVPFPEAGAKTPPKPSRVASAPFAVLAGLNQPV